MRMRKKPNLDLRMEQCSKLLIQNPKEYRGRWLELKPDAQEVRLELGCGKGRFTAETARQNPQALYIAVERVPDAMIVAMERVRDLGLDNVYFIDGRSLYDGPDRDSCSVDGLHPNDLGFFRMAQTMEPVLRTALASTLK